MADDDAEGVVRLRPERESPSAVRWITSAAARYGRSGRSRVGIAAQLAPRKIVLRLLMRGEISEQAGVLGWSEPLEPMLELDAVPASGPGYYNCAFPLRLNAPGPGRSATPSTAALPVDGMQKTETRCELWGR